MDYVKKYWQMVAITAAIVAGVYWFASNLSTPAAAADLGGNCCADLEERIAELESTVAKKGNRKVSVTVSGQVNKAFAYFDDGDENDVQVIDNTTDGSRLLISGVAAINTTTRAGYVLELGLAEDGTQLDGDIDPQDNTPFVRRSFFYVESDLGRLSLGQVEGAAFNITQMSTANTTVVAPTLNLLGFAPARGVIQNNVRYDTPSLGGLVGSASFGTENDSTQLAARFANEYGGFRLAAGVAYTNISEEFTFSGEDFEFVGGSASVMHLTTGLFLTGAAAAVTDNASDSLLWHLQGGIERKWFDVGRTTLFAEYADLKGLDEGAELYGAGVVQAVDAAALDLYLSYRHLTDGDDEDADVIIGGARIAF